jgi:hypothetical protein
MARHVIPVRVNGVELLVETVPVAGTEPTAKLGESVAKVVDAFAEAEAAIVAISARVATVVEQAAKKQCTRRLCRLNSASNFRRRAT